MQAAVLAPRQQRLLMQRLSPPRWEEGDEGAEVAAVAHRRPLAQAHLRGASRLRLRLAATGRARSEESPETSHCHLHSRPPPHYLSDQDQDQDLLSPHL